MSRDLPVSNNSLCDLFRAVVEGEKGRWRLPACRSQGGGCRPGMAIHTAPARPLPWTMNMHSGLSPGGIEVPASCCGGAFLQTGGLAWGDAGCRLRDQDTRLCSLQGPALGTERACEARLALGVLEPTVHRPCVSCGKAVCACTCPRLCRAAVPPALTLQFAEQSHIITSLVSWAPGE